MERLTEKFDTTFGIVDYKLVKYNSIVRANARYKLGCLEDLEEELGCPLEVVFKALQNGFKYKVVCHKLGTKQESVEQIIYCDYAYIYYADDVKAWFISTINECFYLSDYKKTWWLKEDKSE